MLLKYRERREYHGDYHEYTTILYLTLIMEKCVGIWYIYCDINDILLCIRINILFYTRVNIKYIYNNIYARTTATM